MPNPTTTNATRLSPELSPNIFFGLRQLRMDYRSVEVSTLRRGGFKNLNALEMEIRDITSLIILVFLK